MKFDSNQGPLIGFIVVFLFFIAKGCSTIRYKVQLKDNTVIEVCDDHSDFHGDIGDSLVAEWHNRSWGTDYTYCSSCTLHDISYEAHESHFVEGLIIGTDRLWFH